MSASYVQYQTPLPQEQYLQTGLIAAVIGFFILAYFFIYQGAYSKKQRSLIFELVLAVLSAGSIGVGIFLLGLSVGIYM